MTGSNHCDIHRPAHLLKLVHLLAREELENITNIDCAEVRGWMFTDPDDLEWRNT